MARINISFNPLSWLQTGNRVEAVGLRRFLVTLLALPLALFIGYQALAGTNRALANLLLGLVVAYPLALAMRYLFGQRYRQYSIDGSQVLIAIGVVVAGFIWFWADSYQLVSLPAGNLPPLALAVLFVAATYPIAFATLSWRGDCQRITRFDWLLVVLSLVAGGYLVLQTDRYAQWISGIDEFSDDDLTAALVYLALTLELLRRSVGAGLSLVVYSLVAYLFLGHLLEGTFSHRPFGLVEFAEQMIISESGGLFGVPLQVAASYAFLFILFGKLLEASGGGQFFFDLAAAVAGRREGGVAKVAVVSSGLFGTLSGSPAADVMTTGAITIPMMKRLGYGGVFAGAVESVASTGGSLLPPVMGAAVFLMVEFTAIPYAEIAYSAIAVGLFYYLSIYLQVHWRSRRLGLTGMEPQTIPAVGQTLANGWYQLLALVALVGLLVAGFGPAFVAASAVLVLLVSSNIGQRPITPAVIARVCSDGCSALAPLIAAVTAAGLVIGCLNITGLAGKLATLIFLITDGAEFGSLLMAMVITLILGMGMPVVAAYALVATLIAPVLLELGLPILQVHLFLVYFSVLSAITPPVAIACFVASSIADENPMAIAWQSIRLALVAFAIPFLFLYQPGLLLQGSVVQIVVALVGTGLGIWLLSLVLEGYDRAPLAMTTRLLLLAASLCALAPAGWLLIPAILVAVGYYRIHRQGHGAIAD